MEESSRVFLTHFASFIINKDYDSAYNCLSEGAKKQISKTELQAVVEKNFMEVNEEWDFSELIYPESFEIDYGSHIKFDYFKEQENKDNYALFRLSEKIPDDITKDNYRYWANISFLASEKQVERLELDGWFDFWCILIQIDNEYKIGYFEIHELD